MGLSGFEHPNQNQMFSWYLLIKGESINQYNKIKLVQQMVSYFYSIPPNKKAGNISLLKIVLPCVLQTERPPGLHCWEGLWRQEAPWDWVSRRATSPWTSTRGRFIILSMFYD